MPSTASRTVSFAREKFGAARLLATSHHGMPYLAHALFAMVPVPTHAVPTLAVDEAWRLYVNPEFVDSISIRELAAVLIHEACHMVRDHAGRARDLGVAPTERFTWNLCADAEINDDLLNLPLPRQPIVPDLLGLPRHGLAEEYFASRPEDPENCTSDCGSGADGRPRSWDLPTDGHQGEVSPMTAELIRHAVAAEILATPAGQVTPGFRAWALALRGPSVSWKRVLRSKVRNATSAVSGKVDYSYSRPSRRPTFDGIVLPTLRAPSPEVVVVIDTSGSMVSRMDLLEQALGELRGIIRDAGSSDGAVRVVVADAAVHAVQRVWAPSAVELVGGGGTDMGAGIDAARTLVPRPNICVVLTDGYTPWPASPPPFPVVVALLDGGASDPPSWASVVRING